jgi:hypothetical protein
MHSKVSFAFVGALSFGLVGAMGAPARAGLVGDGTNSVSALFFFGAPAAPSPPYTSPAPSEIEDYNGPSGPTNSPPPTIPANFIEGALDLSTIVVGDAKITITNLAPPGSPFCTVTRGSCPDAFTGFAFTFSSGVDITGVGVDPASAADFLPNGAGSHNGLQLLDPTDIIVDVTGDAPAVNDELILDVTTKSVTPPAVPEPSTWALTLFGFAGLGFARYRRAGAAPRVA